MTEFISNHPFLTYLVIAGVFGLYLVIRWTPQQLRLRAENLNKAADEMEDIQKQTPFPEMFTGMVFFMGIFWVFFIPLAMFRKLYRIVWGVERIE